MCAWGGGGGGGGVYGYYNWKPNVGQAKYVALMV